MGVRCEKEHTDGPRQLLQRLKTGYDELPQFFPAVQRGFRHAVVFWSKNSNVLKTKNV
jgi:hypothetical protein